MSESNSTPIQAEIKPARMPKCDCRLWFKRPDSPRGFDAESKKIIKRSKEIELLVSIRIDRALDFGS